MREVPEAEGHVHSRHMGTRKTISYTKSYEKDKQLTPSVLEVAT